MGWGVSLQPVKSKSAVRRRTDSERKRFMRILLIEYSVTDEYYSTTFEYLE
jgi:hypothetical protein